MKKFLSLLLFLSLFLVSCSKIRESAGVNRKNIDEFKVVENPPLIIPPDFNLLPPEQLSEKNIDNTDSDLAKEILFGLNENSNTKNIKLSTMEGILIQSKANEVENNIRQKINEEFASEKPSRLTNWDDEVDILDSIAESERLRNKLLGIDTETNPEIPTIKIKNKKKKRFIFF